MILRIEELREVCTTILPAVDSTELSPVTETLHLKVESGMLLMSVTNREYFLRVRLKVDENEQLEATVNATLFLKLVAQTTSETVQLEVDNQSLVFTGNGTYKIPLIYDNDQLLQLPEIAITNVTTQFAISSDILNSILNNNTKQLSIGTLSNPVQKLYYVDEEGAITFTSGACVNSFKLPNPVKMLFNARLVKLFKLFSVGNVDFTMGQEQISADMTQTRVKFETPSISLTAILPGDDMMLNSVPVSAIRSRATATYEYSVSVDRRLLLETLSRIKLFTSVSDKFTSHVVFAFDKNHAEISDAAGKAAVEKLTYSNNTLIDDKYTLCVDLNELYGILDTCTESHLNLNFGDHKAVALIRGSVTNIIPEVLIS